MIQHRALVDRALVGDFAAIDRQRRIEQHGAGNPGRRSGRGRQKFGETFAKRRADQGVGGGRGEVVGGSAGLTRRQPSRSRITSADISSRLMPAITTSRTSGAQAATKPRAQRTDADPGAAGELEILGDAAVEIEAGMKSSGIDRLERVAEFVEAFLVERGRGQLRLAPIARRDIRALGAHFQLAVVRDQLGVVARDGQADMAGAAGCGVTDMKNGEVSVAPSPVSIGTRKPVSCTASSSRLFQT